MNDKELLELAAKAASMEIDWYGDKALTVQMFRGHLKNWLDWNPLEDDGDALRLAVKLRISLQFDFDRIDAVAKDGEILETEYIYKNPKTDEYATSRRAIVRAAAEIGKDLK